MKILEILHKSENDIVIITKELKVMTKIIRIDRTKEIITYSYPTIIIVKKYSKNK